MCEDKKGREGQVGQVGRGEAPAAMPSGGQANPRRGISEGSRGGRAHTRGSRAWGPGWGRGAIEEEVLTRRQLLKQAGLFVGAVVVVPVMPATAAQEPLRSLTRLEYDT